jgi:hypothetical protein
VPNRVRADLRKDHDARLVDREITRQVRLAPDTEADDVTGAKNVRRFSRDAGTACGTLREYARTEGEGEGDEDEPHWNAPLLI